ncbi:helix-turn-helix domain-containing protein [Fructilactobacillus florum]|uniref:helix-turn-helix domain-containing protein n=1 Tax=Fructilactobacillus florum TaxID=640331 RepID=UPI000685FCA4|nr:helix-turn-helix transcriptional regulator [Fructilactobacillus florum]
MGFDVENAAKILGNNIMIERKNRGLSQYELADGICSQSMISSIEKGHYVPNSILLAQLCNKLGISIHNAMLNNFFEIGESRENTKKIENLCNNHRYEELIEFMNKSNLLDSFNNCLLIQFSHINKSFAMGMDYR